MSAPIGGVGGRSTRYQITDKQPQQLGVIEAGSVLVNESTKTPIFVGDTSVSSATGVMIYPGNTATWTTTTTAYAIAGASIGSTGMSEPYAQLMVSNIISKIDSTVVQPVGSPMQVLSSWVNMPANEYREEHITIGDQYKSLIIVQKNVLPGNFEADYYFDFDNLPDGNYINGQNIYNAPAVILPVTSNVFYHSMNSTQPNASVWIYGSMIDVIRVQTVQGMAEGPAALWRNIQVTGDNLTLSLQQPYYGHMCRVKVALQFDTAPTWPTDIKFMSSMYDINGTAFTVPIYIANSSDWKVSTDNKTVIIEFDVFADCVFTQPLTTTISGMTGITGKYYTSTEVIG